jgi:TonB family protein
VRPVLDEAIDGLDERDRRAVLLRYFSSAGFGDLGRQLGLNENAARMRVERALGKLRERLERKGIKSSSAALAAALSAHAISAAPPGVAAAAAAQAAAAGTGTAVGAWLAFMSSSKFPLSLAATVILGGASVFTLQERAIRRTSDEVAASAGAAGALSALEAQNQQLRASAQEALGLQRDAASLPALRAYAKVLEERASRSGPAAAPSPEAPKAPMLDDAQSAFDITKLDQRPKALLQVRPQYPAALRAIGASGEALVDFIVGSDGRVYNAYAVSASVNGEAETADGPQFVVSAAGRGSAGSSSDSLKTDSSAFESAAVQAVSQWTFQPGQVNGQSVNTHMRVPIVFSVAPAPAPTAATWF